MKTELKKKPAAKKAPVKAKSTKKKVVKKTAKKVAPKKAVKKAQIAVKKSKVNPEVQAELDNAKARTKFHLERVKEETGKILPEDKKYCKDLTTRILKHKFPQFKIK